MKNCLYIVPALFAVAAASNIRGDAFEADLDVKDLFALPDAQDQQPPGESSCPFDGSAAFFNVGVKIAGPATSKFFCKKAILTQIGEMINEKLGEVGVGDELASSPFMAGVCQDPETVTSTGPHRELWNGPDFSWDGTGSCQGCCTNCGNDNGDKRRNRHLTDVNTVSFANHFASDMTEIIEEDLRSKVAEGLADNSDFSCIGTDPEIEVTIEVLRGFDILKLRTQCGGTPINLIRTRGRRGGQ